VGRNIHLIFVENLKAIKMDKNNLVILRGSNELKLGSDTLTPNEHYRRLSNGEDSHIVNGIRMNELFSMNILNILILELFVIGLI
jgi:hypothetical protein